MPIITTIDQVQQFVRVNQINTQASLPNFDTAIRRYLIPVISQALYEEIEDGTGNTDLLQRSRAVVVPLAYMLDLPTIQTQITDVGLRTASTDNLAAAHRWEYNMVYDQLCDSGAYAQEELLRFLFSNKDDFPAWLTSDEYKRSASLIFKTGADFSYYFALHHPHRIYWALRIYIKEVQDLYVSATVGAPFLDSLIKKDAPSEQEAYAIELCKKSVAPLSIYTAIAKMACKVAEEGFTVLMASGNIDSSQQGKEEADDKKLARLSESCERTGNAYLSQLKQYLDDNASETVFADYFTSSFYKPKTAPAASRNSTRRGVYGF